MGDPIAAPVREFKSKVGGNNSCEFCGNRRSKTKRGSFCKACKRVYTVNGINSTIAQHDALSSCNPHGKSSHDIWQLENTVTAAARDSAVKQWAHMVCTLWMPGTRCLNFETMGVFDVSGVTVSNRKMVSWLTRWCELLLYLLIEQQFIWDLCLSSSRLSLAIGRGFFFLETGYSYVTSQSVFLLWFTTYASCDSKDFKKWAFKSSTLLLIVAGLLHMQAEGWCLYKMPFAHMLHSFSCVVCPWKGRP